jgi:hypothetical protein
MHLFLGVDLTLVGTFVPVFGAGATALAFGLLKGRRRVFWMIAIPAIVLAFCLAFGEELLSNGNLLFAALFGLFLVATICVYFPVMIIWGIRTWRRRTTPG